MLHPARNGSFRMSKPSLSSSRGCGALPKLGFCDHAKDQFAHFPADWLPSNRLSGARDPTPSTAETLPDAERTTVSGVTRINDFFQPYRW